MAKAVLAVRNGDAVLAQPVGFGQGFGQSFGGVVTTVDARLVPVTGGAALNEPAALAILQTT